jgi:hypothetical protein
VKIIEGGIYWNTGHEGYVRVTGIDPDGERGPGEILTGPRKGDRMFGWACEYMQRHKGDLWHRAATQERPGGVILGAPGDHSVKVLVSHASGYGKDLGHQGTLKEIKWETFVPYDPAKHAKQLEPAADPPWICCHCGEDVKAFERFRDAEHRQWCKRCYDNRPPAYPERQAKAKEHPMCRCALLPAESQPKCKYATPQPIVTDPPLPEAVFYNGLTDSLAPAGTRPDFVAPGPVQQAAEQAHLITLWQRRVRELPECELSGHPLTVKLVGTRLCYVCSICED